MKSYLKKYSLLLFLLIGVASCDLLEVDTVSGITNVDYWKSEGDMQSYLYGIYTKFRDIQNTTYYFEDRSDVFVPGMVAGLTSAWHQNLNPQSGPNWLSFYEIIHHCNLLLKYSDGIQFRIQEDKDRILAETYFIRAYIYFCLVRSWGDVPLELDPTESDNKPMLARTSAEEVMTQILKDIDAAIELFPEAGYVNKSRASRPACYALKADALLWKAKVLDGGNEDLEEVITAADKAGEGLALEADFSHIFATDRKNGKEVIFSLHFERDEKDDHYSRTLKPNEIHVQDAVNRNEIAYSTGARNGFAPSPKFKALFDENANDVRKYWSFIEAKASDGSVIAVFDNKFRGTSASENRFFDNDIILYRFAEMLLFKAEALASLGRIDEAIAALNQVRNRAQTGNYAGPEDKTAVEKEILEERFREFYLELKRWPDLVRFHHAGTIDVYEEVPNLVGKDVPLFFPVPQIQIDRNPALEQTEGY